MLNALQIMLIGFSRVAATRLYYAEEMLASLALVAVLFSCVAAVFLLLFTLERASQALIEFVELCGKKVWHHTWKRRITNENATPGCFALHSSLCAPGSFRPAKHLRQRLR